MDLIGQLKLRSITNLRYFVAVLRIDKGSRRGLSITHSLYVTLLLKSLRYIHHFSQENLSVTQRKPRIWSIGPMHVLSYKSAKKT